MKRASKCGLPKDAHGKEKKKKKTRGRGDDSEEGLGDVAAYGYLTCTVIKARRWTDKDGGRTMNSGPGATLHYDHYYDYYFLLSLSLRTAEACEQTSSSSTSVCPAKQPWVEM